MFGTAALVLGALSYAVIARMSGDVAGAAERTALAVLPFQNLSAEGPHAYFAGGLHDEILTQLSKVAALKVISRTSVMGYAGPNTPPLRQVAKELGVGSIVQGSVQVVGERLRVHVQLVDATSHHVEARLIGIGGNHGVRLVAQTVAALGQRRVAGDDLWTVNANAARRCFSRSDGD